jgi:hypothetical protein
MVRAGCFTAGQIKGSGVAQARIAVGIDKTMLKHLQDEAIAKLGRSKLKRSLADQPLPCRDLTHHAAEISLYLNLHCPRCGQLSMLDPRVWQRSCLLEDGQVHQYLLDGTHHEFEQ